jgi:Flp pilus assembly pilin Flp
MKIKEFLKYIWQDERGALTTVEVIGYTVLIGGAVALVGYGATTLARGKMGNATNAITSMKANSQVITSASDYSSGTGTIDGKTGIRTGISPTN